MCCIFLEADLNSFSPNKCWAVDSFTLFLHRSVWRSDDIIEKSSTDPESSSPSVQSKDYWVTRHHFRCTDTTEFPSLQLVVPETLLFPRHLARHCWCTSQTESSLSLCIFTSWPIYRGEPSYITGTIPPPALVLVLSSFLTTSHVRGPHIHPQSGWLRGQTGLLWWMLLQAWTNSAQCKRRWRSKLFHNLIRIDKNNLRFIFWQSDVFLDVTHDMNDPMLDLEL